MSLAGTGILKKATPAAKDDERRTSLEKNGRTAPAWETSNVIGRGRVLSCEEMKHNNLSLSPLGRGRFF
jgi:hypothetical protein